jgi:hypothetical protein
MGNRRKWGGRFDVEDGGAPGKPVVGDERNLCA